MGADTPAPAPASCAAARQLLDLAIEHGWTVAWQPGHDTSDAPYVTVRAVRDHANTDIRVTWHTRHTGTYRMTSAIARGGPRGWHDITLTRARQLLTAVTS